MLCRERELCQKSTTVMLLATCEVMQVEEIARDFGSEAFGGEVVPCSRAFGETQHA